jgi:hypothetical protein
MKDEELIKICKERNELNFLFEITKQIAETDSICEMHSYCSTYTREMFNNAEKHIESIEMKLRGFKDSYSIYLEQGGLPVYEIYLKHLGVIQ